MTNNMFSISLLPKVTRSVPFSRQSQKLVFDGRDNICLIYMQSGTGAIASEEKHIEIKGGEIICLWERELLSFSSHGGEGFVICFSDRFAEELLPSLKIHMEEAYFVGNDRDINLLAETIVSEFEQEKPNGAMLCSASLVSLLSLVSRNAVFGASKDRAKELEKIAPALSAIHSDCASRDGVEEYAKLCNLSTSYFSHIFTSVIGMSPMDYKRQRRINIAKNLLSGTNLTAKEISTISGFRDPLYFTRCFKQIVGQTPSEFRAEKTKQEI